MRLGEGKDFLLGKNRESEKQSCGLGVGLCGQQPPLLLRAHWCGSGAQFSSVSVTQNGLLLGEESLFHSRPQAGRGNPAAGRRDLENFTL